MNTSNAYRPQSGIPPVVKALLIISIGTYVLVQLLIRQFHFDLTGPLALYNWNSVYFQPWQLITYLFMHSTESIFHLLFNMFGLWMFGSVLERYWGSKRFLTFFLVTGIGAGIINLSTTTWQLKEMSEAKQQYMQHPGYEEFDRFVSQNLPGSYSNTYLNAFLEKWYRDLDNPMYYREAAAIVNEIGAVRLNTPTVGSSGAIYGLLLAFGMLFPNSVIMLLFPPIPMKAKYFVLVFGAIELLSGIRNNIDDNVAHFAHLGGMVFGLFLILWWKKKDREANRNQYFYE